jgi:4-amino-4-deoxy-L-arabinose transferase-like glycosyltransferase
MSEHALSFGDRPAAAAVARRLAAHWYRIALAGVLVIAAFLNLWRLDQNGWANEYYSAAVRSMLHSWSNFFFVSFDPGGLVSVDKPPLSLWLSAASAKAFGYSGVSVLLPSALAGIAAVGILYLLVARYFGRVAGLVAALALAVSPVSVAVNRDNNPDALLAFLLVAVAYAGARAVEGGRLRWGVATAVLVGLAVNTKMMAALIVVPAVAVAYLLLAPVRFRTRLWHLAASTAVLVAVGGAWIAAVELTPASERPYVGSTSDNSALSLLLDYNGLGRITGQEGGTSRGGGLGGAFSGTPGVFRLLNDELGDQAAWLLPLAIVGGLSALAAALLARRRRELGALAVLGGWFLVSALVFSFAGGIVHTYYLSALAPAACGLVGLGVVALWRDARRGGWWLTLPAVAIVATAWLQIDLLRRSGYLPWLQWLVAIAAAASLAGLLVLAVGRPAGRRAAVVAASLAVAVAGLLAAPAAWSRTTHFTAVNGVFPGAGPTYAGIASGRSDGSQGGFPGRGPGTFGRDGAAPPTFGQGGTPPSGLGRGGVQPGLGQGGGTPAGPGRGMSGTSADAEAALAYAKRQGSGTRFTLIVGSEQQAAPLVIEGEDVAAMGGFTGRETVLTDALLERLVSSGEARYFLVGDGVGFRSFGNEGVDTIASTCTEVSAAEWSGETESTGGSTLYDCSKASS